MNSMAMPKYQVTCEDDQELLSLLVRIYHCNNNHIVQIRAHVAIGHLFLQGHLGVMRNICHQPFGC
jgi:hypothetical protein